MPKPHSKASSKSRGARPKSPQAKQLKAQSKTQSRQQTTKANAVIMRLNKVIADSGLCSRRHADEWIENGRVTVNLEPVTTLGAKVNVRDIILVDGNPLPAKKKEYILFHKPVNIVTTRSDEKGRDTIYDVISKRYHHCDPAGRLDRQSSGAIILSNDGDFIHKVTHPSFHMDKVYRVHLNRVFNPKDKKRLEDGILLEPENKMAKVVSCKITDNNLSLTLTLRTGYNRQIRRSLLALGYEVTQLRRLSIGPVELKRLAVGKCRPIDAAIIKDILDPPAFKSTEKTVKAPQPAKPRSAKPNRGKPKADQLKTDSRGTLQTRGASKKRSDKHKTDTPYGGSGTIKGIGTKKPRSKPRAKDNPSAGPFRGNKADKR